MGTKKVLIGVGVFIVFSLILGIVFAGPRSSTEEQNDDEVD